MNGTAQSFLRKNKAGTFGLQITSMIDMFTIILVFLLKSYASSSVDMTPGKGVTLPASTAQESAVEALQIVVSKEGIYVDSKQVVKFDGGRMPASVTAAQDDKFIQPLFDALKVQADKTKSIAKQNETVTFEGKVILQADQGLDYKLLRKVMYTSSFAGYTDFKFAVVSMQ